MIDARNPVPMQGIARLPNISALTSVRFFAALHVALYHLVRPFSLWGPFADFMAAGYMGVSFFFVLSGFILTYSHAAEYESGKGKPVRFWVARFARIYPLYFLSMIFGAYVNYKQFHPAFHIVAFVAAVFMLQSWSMRMVNFFNVPAWTLSCEAFFYFLFPFLFLRMRPSSAAKAWLWAAGMWALAMALPIYCTILYPGSAVSEYTVHGTSRNALVGEVLKVPLFALPEFLAGVAICWIYLRARPAPRILAYMTAAGVLAMIGVFIYVGHFPYLMLHNGVFIPIYALLILGLCGRTWFSRLLENKALVLLGEASFALYLTHFLFNDLVEDRFGAGAGIWAGVWKLGILIPLSILLHLYVERPGRKIILTYWKRREAAATS